MKPYKYALRFVVLLAALAGRWRFSAHAQFRRGGGRFRRPLNDIDTEKSHEQEIMRQAINPEFSEDTFTFPRLKFQWDEDYRFGGGRMWDDDSPDADLNVIFRLHEVTSMKIRPGLNVIDITTKDLADYPFVYIAAAGRVVFTDQEVADLRQVSDERRLPHGG